MNDNGSIGARLRQIREERGYSRDVLAERARRAPGVPGVSADYIKKIEAGDRQPGIAVIYALAAALAVEPSRLLDRRERLEKDIRDGGLTGLRDAIQDPADLPGLGVPEEGEPVPLADLERAVAGAWETYWAGRFGALAEILPGLVFAARATRAEVGTAACLLLAQAYQIAADLLVHTGNDDLAMGAARRAARAASNGDDELQHATLAGTVSWILLHQGRLEKAETVAATMAAQIRPRFLGGGKAPATPAEAERRMAHATVHGALLLSAAAPAAAAGRPDAVAGYIEEARVGALSFTAGDRHDYNVSYGPTQVAMQSCHTSSVLGDNGRAVRAGRRVQRADLLDISWGAHRLDVAQAYLEMGRRHLGDGIEALWEAYEVSAEWSRHQGAWRTLVAAAVQAETRMSERGRKLAAAAGLR